MNERRWFGERKGSFVQRELAHACDEVFFARRHGSEGYSCFAAVAVVGVFHAKNDETGEHHLLSLAAGNYNTDFPESRAKLSAKLRKMADDLDSLGVVEPATRIEFEASDGDG